MPAPFIVAAIRFVLSWFAGHVRDFLAAARYLAGLGRRARAGTTFAAEKAYLKERLITSFAQIKADLDLLKTGEEIYEYIKGMKTFEKYSFLDLLTFGNAAKLRDFLRRRAAEKFRKAEATTRRRARRPQEFHADEDTFGGYRPLHPETEYAERAHAINQAYLNRQTALVPQPASRPLAVKTRKKLAQSMLAASTVVVDNWEVSVITEIIDSIVTLVEILNRVVVEMDRLQLGDVTTYYSFSGGYIMSGVINTTSTYVPKAYPPKPRTALELDVSQLGITLSIRCVVYRGYRELDREQGGGIRRLKAEIELEDKFFNGIL